MTVHLRTVFRTSTAPRAAVVLLPWLFAYSGRITQWITSGYWESVTAQSSFLLVFTAPACAACAAWEAVRVKRSRVLEATPVRPRTVMALSVLLPIFVLGFLSVVLASALFVPQSSGLPGASSMAILGMELLVLAAHTLAGYVAGLTLPGLLAAPAALVTSWLWMAYPAAMTPLWLRQMNGHNLMECCALNQTVAPRALVAPALVAVGVIIASLVWISARRLPGRLWAAVTLCVTLVTGASVAMPLGYEAGQPRDISALRCSGTVPMVCLWPEQQESGAHIRSWSTEARQRLDAAGVSTASTITILSTTPRRDEILALVASTALPGQPPNCSATGPWPGSTAQGTLLAWLMLTAGADPQSVRGGSVETDIQTAEQVRRLPRPAQQRWFDHNAATLHGCDLRPDLDPSHFGRPSGLQAAS
ncbi:DUF7224 domain-containing protein [Streptomyces tagetis]|uniref:DUF7224 domain-containing protein n=1 Tax=Streptomyces tagetis TaxID=2820809 RepID=A0A940XMJ5_9ACTN|nr:hypothetical protein [Streptomyces sp. RG38]MBQ0829101.1 hypothetical protein [Streptomyces sp. RG38]